MTFFEIQAVKIWLSLNSASNRWLGFDADVDSILQKLLIIFSATVYVCLISSVGACLFCNLKDHRSSPTLSNDVFFVHSCQAFFISSTSQGGLGFKFPFRGVIFELFSTGSDRHVVWMKKTFMFILISLSIVLFGGKWRNIFKFEK